MPAQAAEFPSALGKEFRRVAPEQFAGEAARQAAYHLSLIHILETWAVMVTWFSPFSMAARSLSPSGVFTVTTGILESRSTVEGTGWPQMGLMDML